MIIEAFVLVGAIALVMFLFAESRKPIAGIFGSVLLMILSYWTIADGIQIQAGQNNFDLNTGLELGTANGTNDGSSLSSGNTTTFTQGMKTNITTATTGTTNSTVTNIYADIPTTPFIRVANLLGVMLLLFSLYLFFYYLFATIGNWK